MKLKNTLAILALTAFGALSAPVSAQEILPFKQMAMEKMDRNKDGMITKAEYIKMMEKVWDMKAAEMKVQGGKMTMQQLEQVIRYVQGG